MVVSDGSEINLAYFKYNMGYLSRSCSSGKYGIQGRIMELIDSAHVNVRCIAYLFLDTVRGQHGDFTLAKSLRDRPLLTEASR